jgi:hypothetical protein
MIPSPDPTRITSEPPVPAAPSPTTADSPGSSAPWFSALDYQELRASNEVRAGWLWHGYLAPGSVTLLTSQWKSGKTTLVSVLLARLKTGGLLAGLPLRRGRAVVVSEEDKDLWVARGQSLDFNGHVWWLCRPFGGKPRPDGWLALVDFLARLCQQRSLDLVVLDTLPSFLPGLTENNAGSMMEVLLSLQRLTALNASVLVLHHPRKGEAPEGQAARGSGALSGFVDILLEMGWYGRPSDDDRRRRLRGYSRHEATPRRRVIELSADGTDYRALEDVPPDDFEEGWQRLHAVLEDAGHKLTRRQVLEEWPPDYPKPEGSTLWRWLDRAVQDGQVLREGTGRKNHPFRYWLEGMEKKWQASPFYLPELPPLE